MNKSFNTRFFARTLVCLILFFEASFLFGQSIKGKVMDGISKAPLPGASIRISSRELERGTVTDGEGIFRLDKLQPGKYNVKITYLGYKEMVTNDLSLFSGKDLSLEFELEENLTSADEIVIRAQKDRAKALNEMQLLSSRSFSVEDTRRYAAAVNDPARMAVSFAGVNAADDGNNLISVRGNAPYTLKYHMEGIEIPNPNHFADAATTGGGISILSAQLLAQSDFVSGAFASEYGNALSSVFDLKLRKGNSEKREHTIQAGFLGIDIASEGPFAAGRKGSYLVNYRYSTLGLLSKMGVPIGTGITTFQDLSYNINLPLGNSGSIGVFGFGGLSSQEFNAIKDSTKWESDFDKRNSLFSSNSAANGISIQKNINTKSYFKTVLLYGISANVFDAEEPNQSNTPKAYQEKFYQNRWGWSFQFNHKFNPKSNIRTGFVLTRFGFELAQKYRETPGGPLWNQMEARGDAYLYQSYFQWKYRPFERLNITAGLHAMATSMNKDKSIEPRLAASYAINEKSAISVSSGFHSQMQPLGLYYGRVNGVEGQPNTGLELSRSFHQVLAYEYRLKSNYKLKTELYFQSLTGLPVSPFAGNSLAAVNQMGGFITDSLVSQGEGQNKGVELTLERVLSNEFYFLLSTSVFNSSYRTADGTWLNTRFNSGHTFCFTVGKEWIVGKSKNNRLGINAKMVWSGGLRETPIDKEASRLQGKAVYQQEKSWSVQNPDYLRLDLRLSYRKNHSKSNSIFSLDIQNATNRKNIGGSYFDVNSGQVKTWYQSPLIPIFSYRIEF